MSNGGYIGKIRGRLAQAASYTREQVDALLQRVTAQSLSPSSTNNVSGTGHTHEVNGFLAANQNLNDLANKTTTRNNLSVYSKSEIDGFTFKPDNIISVSSSQFSVSGNSAITGLIERPSGFSENDVVLLNFRVRFSQSSISQILSNSFLENLDYIWGYDLVGSQNNYPVRIYNNNSNVVYCRIFSTWLSLPSS